jgi:hypothetical protein
MRLTAGAAVTVATAGTVCICTAVDVRSEASPTDDPWLAECAPDNRSLPIHAAHAIGGEKPAVQIRHILADCREGEWRPIAFAALAATGPIPAFGGPNPALCACNAAVVDATYH